MGAYFKGIILIIIILFFITFGVKNNEPVRLNYYLNILNVEVPIYGLVYVSILIGIFVGMVTGFRGRRSLRRTVKNLERENRELKEKLIKEKEEKKEES